MRLWFLLVFFVVLGLRTDERNCQAQHANQKSCIHGPRLARKGAWCHALFWRRLRPQILSEGPSGASRRHVELLGGGISERSAQGMVLERLWSGHHKRKSTSAGRTGAFAGVFDDTAPAVKLPFLPVVVGRGHPTTRGRPVRPHRRSRSWGVPAYAWGSTAGQRAATNAANPPERRCAPPRSVRACSH